MWKQVVGLLALFIVLSQAVQGKVTDHATTLRRQAQTALPQCASQCLASLLPTTKCAPTDVECLCQDNPLLEATAACVQANCTVIEALTTQRVQTTSICPQPVRDQSGLTVRVVWALFSLALFSVLARLLSRLQRLGGSGFGHDDWTILLGLLLLIPLNVILHFMALDGLGKDIWMVMPGQITNILYLFWVEEFLYTFILAVTRISILLLYLRMWPDTESRKFRNACIGLIVLLSVYAVTMNVVLAASCSPVSYAW
ncbi:hypothetical protein CLAFUW4_11395 [Fulvia fulva]|uniref:CFEM domain-containing protein n=1 Tax=Passalora fulva TaxID=5499 RepID=A0A9Q8PCA9_PASFU|nr:uncharacterized protein CLAFUR5_10438 [Fulvia fulva]KAK4620088.1 hypothetical protein CLAFUR4_11401 [Fulvia fulva]KAK4620627.1 hypothetical protein CLAFUR0_11407 [Fulvia fulva]UJO19919.1 hypothetical protein CLAFUR5_10438 [Fulvia fulva]WPV17560.1 hypothetical protein CLAFUW4_11395 [Fulvia fulva]WPV32549.1 hypothetical protein CLAFUW7_11391 [Fulvia fulva]